MAWIKTVSDDAAEGLCKRIFDSAKQRAGRVFNVVRVMSLNPRVMRDAMTFYVSACMGESPLTRAQREMLAVVVSRKNDCFY